MGNLQFTMEFSDSVFRDKLGIFFFGDTWDALRRRRQMLAIELSKLSQVERVVYIEEPLTIASWLRRRITGRGTFGSDRWERPRRRRFSFMDGGVQVVAPFSISRSYIRALRFLNRAVEKWSYTRILRARRSNPGEVAVAYVSSPFVPLDILRSMKPAFLCYDCSEDYAELYESHGYHQGIVAEVREADQYLTRIADLVVVVSLQQYREKAELNQRIVLLPNGVEFSRFAEDHQVEPVDLSCIPHPRLGYVGLIDSTIDIDLLESLARKRPDWSLVVIGDKYHHGIGRGRIFYQLDNIHFLGRKPYITLPAYLHCLDVCLIPYISSHLNNTRSSLKLLQYLSAGKPVVSTNIECVQPFSEVVDIADDTDEFVKYIRDNIPGVNSKRSARQMELARQNSWDSIARRLDQEIANRLESQGRM